MSCSATLKKNGFRITKPRKAILDFVHDNGDHITAEEIINHVHKKFPRTNKSTIYRTLQLLEDNECVFRTESKDQNIYHHAEEGHHHHLVCNVCGATIDCGEDIFSPVEHSLKNQYGFSADFKHLVMSGICKQCQKKKT